MYKADNPKFQHLLGKLIFSRVKYTDNSAELLSAPAAMWLVEQLKPQHILAVNSSASLYFAVCQAAEKQDTGMQCAAFNSTFLDDKAALHYHQQQYAELSVFANVLEPALEQVQLVILNPQPEQEAHLEKLLADVSKTASGKVLAVTAKQHLSGAAKYFSANLVLPQLILYWQKGQQPVLDGLLAEAEQLSFLQHVLHYTCQALTDRILATQSESLQQALSVQQQSARYCKEDNNQLKQQVTQQALQIERQVAELATLANNLLLAEQTNSQLQQQQFDKEALLQQLTQQHQLLQQQHADLTQQLQSRTTELANLTIKLEQFNSQHYQLVQLQQTNSQISAKLAEQADALRQRDEQNSQAAAELTSLQQQLAQEHQQYLQLVEQKQALHAELKQVQTYNTQLQTELNEKDKHSFLVQHQLLEEKLALQQYQREAAKFTLMLQQQEQMRNAAAQRIQDLQQQLKSMQQLKTVKLAKAVAKLTHPFAQDQQKQQLLHHKRLIAESGWFDEQWYLTTYPDVAANQQDPITHYLKFGGFEGRNPHPSFDSQWYIQQYPDVAAQGINPLLHYIKFGQQEGRATRAGDTL